MDTRIFLPILFAVLVLFAIAALLILRKRKSDQLKQLGLFSLTQSRLEDTHRQWFTSSMWTHCGKHINERGLLFPWEIATAQHAQPVSQPRNCAGLLS